MFTVLSFLAGWTLPEIPVADDGSKYTAEPCLRVTAVVRLAAGRPEVPGPFLLVQTAWTQGARRQDSPSTIAECEASDQTLPLPPIHNRIFRRRGAAFELLPAPDVERILDRLFELPSDPTDQPSVSPSYPSSEAT